jgi:uncharacterized membrane protein YfcA
VIGVFLGGKLCRTLDSNKLKPAFGYFVLVMGFMILGRELIG